MLSITAICVLAFTAIASCDTGNDVKFFLSTETENRTELDYDNLDSVDVEKPIFVLLHGWQVGSNDSWVIELTAELLEQGDYNIIAVDYTTLAKQEYVAAVISGNVVGEYTGELITTLYANYSANLTDFHVIGHSIGGQVAGLIGKNVQRLTGLSIGRITSLDPAGAFYFPTYPSGRIASTDADIVVTLHTDGLGWGYGWQIGGVDFYANSGNSPQPGCVLGDVTLSRCSQYRAPALYLEAVRNPGGFVSTKCSNFFSFELGLCSENNKITLGGNFTQSDYGIYYFNTNAESPYSLE